MWAGERSERRGGWWYGLVQYEGAAAGDMWRGGQGLIGALGMQTSWLARWQDGQVVISSFSSYWEY